MFDQDKCTRFLCEIPTVMYIGTGQLSINKALLSSCFRSISSFECNHVIFNLTLRKMLFVVDGIPSSLIAGLELIAISSTVVWVAFSVHALKTQSKKLYGRTIISSPGNHMFNILKSIFFNFF